MLKKMRHLGLHIWERLCLSQAAGLKRTNYSISHAHAAHRSELTLFQSHHAPTKSPALSLNRLILSWYGQPQGAI